MKLPASILARLRGPLVAVTMAGCAPPATAPLTEDAPPAREAELTSDPVAYDAQAERERLVRLDREHAADEHRRERRIEDAEPRSVFGQIGPGRWIHPACGRG